MIVVPSMWFWSVSWSTNCSVFFSFFLVDQKKKLSSLREFLVSLWEFLVNQIYFGTPKKNLVDQKFPKTDQKFPETGQFFFGRPKKMRKRLDNWSTKRLTKTTWTGLLSSAKVGLDKSQPSPNILLCLYMYFLAKLSTVHSIPCFIVPNCI